MGQGSSDLSPFRKAKLLHEYYTFYDINKDGELTWKDFDLAREQISTVSKWKTSDVRYKKANEMFIAIWYSLTREDDTNFDDKISECEWLQMWDKYGKKQQTENEKAQKENRSPKNVMPPWLDTYIEYKFNLYDTSGNGELDMSEFAEFLENFDVPREEAEECFKKFSLNNTKKVDLPYFKELCKDYYGSEDQNALGSYVNGKVKFDITESTNDKK